MSAESNENLLDAVAIARWMVERQFIRQMRLKSLQELNRLASDLGVGLSPWNEDVQHLWQIGILRADFLVSKQPLDMEGVVFIEQNDGGEHIFADARDCVKRIDGLGNVIEDLGTLPDDVYLMFHPFRYYVLYRIEQELIPRLYGFQILRSVTSYQKTVERFLTSFNEETADEHFRARVRGWNEIVSLAVAVEPFTYNRLFGYYKVPVTYENNEEGFYTALRKQYEDCKALLLNIGLDGVMDVLNELCREAERLEPKDDIRRLVRLTKRYRIERIKGKLGGSVYLLTMAEMIRRAAERVFETELPEEDELGLGGGSETADYKEYFYGSPRLLDSHEAKSTFIQRLNLDYTVRLRWYVEGDTELYALQSELTGDENIEIINLRGEVVAGKGKGLSFRENLLNDIRRSVYSFVYLDGDVDNNRRVLLRAVENREMFGMFFISKPDFEFGNFNSDELAGILWEMASEKGALPEEKENFLKLTCAAESGKQLFDNANKALPDLRLDKGKTWGERLLNFAKENSYLQRDGVKKTRPIIEGIMLARHTVECGYYLSREECRVDANTGTIVGVKKYFAYGSNLLKKRLVKRAPSALVRAAGYIEGYKIRCNKRSVDGSGKGNLLKTEDEKDRVYGVVYDFLGADKLNLDKHEGLGNGYNAEEIRVITDNGEIRAYTYVADEGAVDDSLKPYSWCKDLVVEGARRHSLPSEYITQLECIEADSDSDAERERLNRQSLGG
jgi:gamma-glutamylcyclotransferase